MKNILPLFTALTLMVFAPLCSAEHTNHLITSKSAGPIHLGMRIAAAEKLMKGDKFERTSDGDGVALIAVLHKGESVMTLYAGETDKDSKINHKAVIEHIEVTDRHFRTKVGVHAGMPLKQAERSYGKVRQIEMSEIESREFAIFTKRTPGLTFRVEAEGTEAGRYNHNGKNPRIARSYVKTARLYSIIVH